MATKRKTTKETAKKAKSTSKRTTAKKKPSAAKSVTAKKKSSATRKKSTTKKTTKTRKLAEVTAKSGQSTQATKPAKSPKAASTKTASRKKATGTTHEEVTIDRRRATTDTRPEVGSGSKKRRPVERRAKVTRRRQIDPTTCERDYTAEEVEFMSALDDYKRRSGRMFPTCSEVLEVIRKLGYQKVSATPDEPKATASTTPEPVVQSVTQGTAV